MKRRADTEREPMPDWVLYAQRDDDRQAAKAWVLEHGSSVLEWLVASSDARRARREAQWAQEDSA